MINITNKEMCYGCTACANICPKNAIKMTEDKCGFKYPKIDLDKCINCGLCDKICTKEADNNSNEQIEIFACQNKDEKVREVSTSGGMFGVLADEILKQGGVICAPDFDENSKVVHRIVTNKEELNGMYGSKYVQSDLKLIFKVIMDNLKQDRIVFFVGTPCQTDGLLRYISDEHKSKLYTADLICYGVPSPKIYDKWIDFLNKKYNSKVKYINFRDKKYGYSGTNIKIEFENGRKIEDCRDAKSFLKTMFSHIGLRESCYNCKYRYEKKNCDFTFGDIWNIGDYSKRMDDNKGTTLVRINTKKGKDLFANLDENRVDKLLIDEISIDSEKLKNKKEINVPIKRNDFFDDAEVMEYEKLINKYFPIKSKDLLANYLKPIIVRIPGTKLLIKKSKIKKVKGR